MKFYGKVTRERSRPWFFLIFLQRLIRLITAFFDLTWDWCRRHGSCSVVASLVSAWSLSIRFVCWSYIHLSCRDLRRSSRFCSRSLALLHLLVSSPSLSCKSSYLFKVFMYISYYFYTDDTQLPCLIWSQWIRYCSWYSKQLSCWYQVVDVS